jgi:bacteriorhodopsin
MSYALVLSAVRCTLQYVVFPFLLPILGIAGDFPPQIFVVINVIAMAAIISSVLRLWRINYKYKWQYLIVGAAAMVIQVAFTLHDLQLSGVL